jgi:hypothetical protein
MSRWQHQSGKRPVVAGMATMPSRAATFPLALRSILPQVDRLYLYLDGHFDVPEAAQGDPRIVSILSKDIPGLRGNGKFLALSLEPAVCLYLGIDDDIAYPPNYVVSLSKGIQAYRDRAVVGYHGVILARPLVRYTRDRTVFHFAERLHAPKIVDVLGTGTIMFFSGSLSFDVRAWQHVNAGDLCLALEAARFELPLVCLARKQGFLHALEENQADSCYAALRRDDTRETALARQLPVRRGKTPRTTMLSRWRAVWRRRP